jgi:hypothetical protein
LGRAARARAAAGGGWRRHALAIIALPQSSQKAQRILLQRCGKCSSSYMRRCPPRFRHLGGHCFRIPICLSCTLGLPLPLPFSVINAFAFESATRRHGRQRDMNSNKPLAATPACIQLHHPPPPPPPGPSALQEALQALSADFCVLERHVFCGRGGELGGRRVG